MIIVAGHLEIASKNRDDFIARSHESIKAARQNPACSAFVVSADPIEADRVCIYEEWDNAEALTAFRQDGPSDDLSALIKSYSVNQYDIPQPAKGASA